MISFFRKTRRWLLQRNKFSKYLLYAVGEVILIVIGILIALGINNWNQRKIIEEREQFYLAGLQEEFRQSRIKLENLIEVNRLNYEGGKKIIDFIDHPEKLPDEKLLSELLFNSFSYEIDYNPNNSLLNEMINSGSLKDISNTELRKKLTSWESIIQSVHRQEANLREQREIMLDIFRNEERDIRTILDDNGIAQEFMGLGSSTDLKSNLEVLESQEFENNLLIYILTGISTEKSHYEPLLEEIDDMMELIENEIEESN